MSRVSGTGVRASVVLVAFIALCRAQAPADTQKKAAIEGHVTSLTGEPLRKVMVRMQGNFTAPPEPGTPVQPPPVFTAESDAQGNFVIPDVEPGRYNLSAERAGYVRENYGARAPGQGGTPVNLSAGQRLTGIAFKLTPQSVISGKVTDEDGDPLPNARVNVQRSAWLNGRRQLQNVGGANAGPDGSFAVGGLTAGRYFVSATDPQSSNVIPLPAASRGPVEAYVTTYYPGATDTSGAVPIDLAGGNEMRGIEIRLRKARVFRVRGRIASSGPLPPNAGVMILPRDTTDIGGGLRINQAKPDGSFELNRVSPGNYNVQVTMPAMRNADGSMPAPLVGRVAVTVGNDDVDNVVLQLGPGAEITGTITTSGANPQQQQQQQQQPPAPGANALPRVTLGPEGILINSGPTTATAKEDGSFLMRGVGPGVYRVNVTSLPPGTYVKSMRFGGQDITTTKLDLSAGNGGQLQIVLSPNAANLSGVVHNSDGAPLPSVTVALWNPGVPPEGAIDPTRTAQTDPNGVFQFRNLPPGEYRVAAWEQVEPGLVMVPDFRTKFDSKATTVKLGENANENTEAVLIGRDAIESEAAKIR